MLDIAVCHLGHVNQTILMHADIHKCTKINNITDSSLQNHSLFQVLHLQNIGTKDRFRHVVTRVAGRFFQFFYDVAESDLTDSQLFRHLLVISYLKRKTKQISGYYIFGFITKFLKKCGSCVIALRMYTCGIQRIFTSGNTHETCTLLKCFRS